MFQCKFSNVVIDSYAVHLPSIEVTSAEMEDKIAPLYTRLGLPFGTLEKVSGVKSRYFWEDGTLPSKVATIAGQKALEGSSIDRSQIKALLSCSIARDAFEPATACIIHNNLGLDVGSVVFDITNACLGFMNGLLVAASFIESGATKAALVVSGETIEKPTNVCMKHLLSRDDISREDLIRLLPTFTLGSGAVAYLLVHKDLNPEGHKLIGGVCRSATQFHGLCAGNGDYVVGQADSEDFDPIMSTDSAQLISMAAKVGGDTWRDATKSLGWSREDVSTIICHQVGKQLNASNGFFDEMALDIGKQFSIYQKYGNLASAALPSTLVMASEAGKVQKGSKVLLTGFGSGINTSFLGIEW